MIVDLHRLASQRRAVHHSNVARRDTLNVSWDIDRSGNLKASLAELADVKESRWFSRSLASIAGLLLADAIQAELMKLQSAEPPERADFTQGSLKGASPVDMRRGAS